MNKFLLFFIILHSIALWADVLFIDLNNAPMEVDAARRAATARGEKLIVIPKSNSKGVDLDKLYDQSEAIQRRLRDCNNRVNSNCQNIGTELESVSHRINAEEDRREAEAFTKEDLKAALRDLKSPISTILISGHDGGGSFHGENGDMKARDFVDVFKTFPGNENVRSVFLLGCNSATAETFGETWKVAFPTAAFIAGYEHIGFLKDRPEAHKFIYDLMTKEKEILAQKDMTSALRLFKNISPGSSKYMAAACITKKSNEPQYISAAYGADVLAKRNNCPDQAILKSGAEFVKCVKEESGESSLCPLSKAQEFLFKADGCRFKSGDYPENYKILRSEIYILTGLQSKSSVFEYAKICQALPKDTLEKLGISGKENTYADIKNAILKMKRHVDSQTDFDLLEKLGHNELNTLANQKKYFDSMWLGISNLDMSKLRPPRRLTMMMGMNAAAPSGAPEDLTSRIAFQRALTDMFSKDQTYEIGAMKAQAFYIKHSGSENLSKYLEQRVKYLETGGRFEAHTYPEIAALKKLIKSSKSQASP